MDIKSPNERAQHIAGMAYRHIYIPTEEGNRVEVLLDKMFLPQNAYCYAMFPKWFADSKGKTNEADRVRYIMGQLCAYLHHFYDKPSVEDFEKGFDYSNIVKFQRHCENALNSVLDPKDDGSIYQDGVHGTHEEFLLICEFYSKNYIDIDVRCANVTASSPAGIIKDCYIHAVQKRFGVSPIAAKRLWSNNQRNKTYLLNTIHGLA